MLLFANLKTVVSRRGFHMQRLRLGKCGFAILLSENPALRSIFQTALQIRESRRVDLFLFAACEGECGGANDGDGNPF